jgi:PPOX class probable F420-dependent enzyme
MFNRRNTEWNPERRNLPMLDQAIKELAQGKNFAALTVQLPSGQASTQIMWIDADDDHVIFNTEVDRNKFAAIQRDPRVTVAIWDAANPYHYAEVRGRVTATDDSPAAKDHIDFLAKKYMGVDEYPNKINSSRVIVRITPDRQRIQ